MFANWRLYFNWTPRFPDVGSQRYPPDPCSLWLRPTPELQHEFGGACSAPAQPPSAAGSSFFGALELTLGGQGHVSAMAHGASSTASFSSRGLMSSNNGKEWALIGEDRKGDAPYGVTASGMLMGWESVTSFFSSFLYLNVLCGLEHFAWILRALSFYLSKMRGLDEL